MTVVTPRAMRTLQMMTERMTMAANKNERQFGSRAHNFSPTSCQRAIDTVFLTTSRLRRVRLVVRTQPSQGWYTGSTPVRAAIGKASFQPVSRQIRNKTWNGTKQQLLRLLDNTDDLDLPVCLEHRDKPDFLLSTRSCTIGLE